MAPKKRTKLLKNFCFFNTSPNSKLIKSYILKLIRGYVSIFYYFCCPKN